MTKNTNLNLSGEGMKTLLATAAVLLTLVPGLANAMPITAPVPQTWYEWKSEQYKLGSTDKQTNGNTITYDTSTICSKWQACEAEYGDCDLVFGGSRDPAKYDNTAYDNALQGGLAGGRASQLQDAVQTACPASMDDFRVGALISSKTDGYRYSWVKIQPSAEAARMEKKAPLPKDPNERWGFLTSRLLRESDNLCPTYIVADARTQDVHVSDNDCACSNYDAKPSTPKMEVTNDIGIARKLVKDHAEWQAETKDITYVMVRDFLQEGTWSGVTELDETGAESTKTPDDGLSVDFSETDGIMRIRFPNRCEQKLALDQAADDKKAEEEEEAARKQAQADHDAMYKSAGFAGANFRVASSWIPAGSPFNVGTGADVSGHIELGGVVGNGNFSWVFGAEAGAGSDPGCPAPAGLDLGAFTGPWINRQGVVGFRADLAASWLSAPYNGAWSTTRYRFGVDAGPAFQVARKLYVTPALGVGLDMVQGQTSANTFVLTERPWVGGKLSVTKTF